MDAAEAGAPADDVVSQHGAGEPSSVGEEPPGRAVLEPGAFFQVLVAIDARAYADELAHTAGS